MKTNMKIWKGGIISLLIIGLMSAAIVPSTVFAQAAVDPAFNPSLLITDKAFSDSGTFGSPAAIQNFLKEKGSVLANTSNDFLIKLREPDATTKSGLEDPEPNLGRMRTAAELIYDATLKTGLNPQVILVILQKEQSLILGNFSSDADLQRALDRALGFGCPDSQPCGSIFLGFYYQLFGNFDSAQNRYLGAAASLMRSFNTTVDGTQVGRGPEVDALNNAGGSPSVRTSRKGDTINIPNTLGGYAGVASSQSVTLSNFATAALYRYTPHVFNGNYNFWKYFTLWFKYPNGTVIQRIGDTALYIINNGIKQQFSSFVATQRKINTTQTVAVSQTEFDSYTTDKPLTPIDGTLIKGDADATVYYVNNGSLQPISGPIFVQRKFSFGKVVTVPQAEISTYTIGSFLAPAEGTLVTGTADQTVYLIEGGVKRPITYNVFVARKLSFKNLMKLSDGELTNIATGSFLTPPDGVQIKLANDTGIYWYRDGQKRFVSAFVFSQRGVGDFPMVILGADEFNAITTGTPFPPKDGTIIKGDTSDAIYQVSGGLTHLLTPTSYKRLRYPKPSILPQAEVDSYAAGDMIVK